MNQTTKNAIMTLASADPSISREQLQIAMEAFTRKPQPVPVVTSGALDRLLSNEEVGRILGKSKKTIERYARTGLLRRVIRKGGVRATGIAESSVRDFMAATEA